MAARRASGGPHLNERCGGSVTFSRCDIHKARRLLLLSAVAIPGCGKSPGPAEFYRLRAGASNGLKSCAISARPSCLRKAGMTQAIGSVRMARRLISVAPTCAWALHRSQPPVAPWSVRSESATPRARPYQSTRPKILWSRSDSDPLAPSPFRLTPTQRRPRCAPPIRRGHRLPSIVRAPVPGLEIAHRPCGAWRRSTRADAYLCRFVERKRSCASSLSQRSTVT